MAEVRILGLAEAEAFLRQIGATAEASSRVLARAGSNAPYAWGIEFGRKRSGALARRAGGAFMLTNAFQSVQPRIGPRIAEALPNGPGAVQAAALSLMTDVVGIAQPQTPVGTGPGRGNLRRTLHAEGS